MIINKQAYEEILKSTCINLHDSVNILGNGILTGSCSIYAMNFINNLTLGGYSYLSPNSESTNLVVGNYCSIARGFIVGLSHPMDLLTASPVAWRSWIPEKVFPGHTNHDYKQTFIGNDVWIGANVILKEGLSIGDCSIIGAGSVVTKDIPPFSIAVGNPCRVIRTRFSDKFTSEIINTSWFNYDWANFNLNWKSPNDTLNEMKKIISLNKSVNFQSYKYEVLNDGVQFSRLK
jgi:acetyltransferase-like isoleucine patch superfamily enzyme